MKQAALTLLALLGLAMATLEQVKSLPGSANALKQPLFTPLPTSPITVGPMAGEPAIADCNHDGNLDIILACGTCCGSRPSPMSGHVIVLLGDGRGRFERARSSPIPVGPSARKVALGDVNQDAHLDILVAQHDSYDVVVLLGDGRGVFKPAPNSPVLASKGTRPHTHDISTGDVNGDGKIDVLTTNANDNNVSVLLGDGKGGFSHAEGSPVAAGRHPYDVVLLHDMDLDGKVDLITPNLRGNAVMVMRGDGAGRFSAVPGSPFSLGPRPGYVVAADVNGDRKPDLVATHDDDPLAVILLGDGRGGFRPAPGSPLRTDSPVWGTAIGDLNGDGKNDVAMTAMLASKILVMLGNGQGEFVPAAGPPLQAGDLPSYVALADLNKDGRLDIVASNYGSGDLTVLLNSTR